MTDTNFAPITVLYRCVFTDVYTFQPRLMNFKYYKTCWSYYTNMGFCRRQQHDILPRGRFK